MSHPYDIHKDYPRRRRGRLSRNPLIFLLDILCQRIPGQEHECLSHHLCMWLWIANWFFYAPLLERGIDTSWLFFLFLEPLLFIEPIYRHLRHRYIKRHDLPGPYGYGTIDPLPAWQYG